MRLFTGQGVDVSINTDEPGGCTSNRFHCVTLPDFPLRRYAARVISPRERDGVGPVGLHRRTVPVRCARLSMPCAPWQQTIGECVQRIRRRERHLIDGVGMRGGCTRSLEHRLA